MASGIKKFFLVSVLNSIKETMPAFVSSSIIALLPVSLLLTIFEIFGLVILIPVIQILLKPDVIYENSILSWLYFLLQSPGQTIFVMYLLAFIGLVFIIKNAIIYWASLRQTKITYDTAMRLTNLQFQKYLYQPYQNHVRDNTSVLLRKIIEIPYNFTTGIMLPVVVLINEVIIAAIIILGIFVYNPLLLISIVGFITPFFLLYTYLYKNQLRAVSKDREMGHRDMFRNGRQSIEGFREILLFNKFYHFVPAFNASVKRFSKAMAHIYHLNAFSPKIIETLAVLSVFGIFLTGVIFQHNVNKLAAFLATFAIAAYRLIPSVNKMIYCYNNIKSSDFVFDHFRSIAWDDQRVSGHDSIDPNVAPLPFQHKIELKNISFSFYDDKVLLSQVNLTIQKGETIGIIGKSGSGKSTLINILLGLYQPSEGQIFLDGKEIDESVLKNWYSTISFVPQNPVLIEGSISENIAFGIPLDYINADKLNWAINHSGLREFIDTLPQGLGTRIGDKSLNISGGQKQRIAIARALYHNGKILIFDEATSSLDRETELLLTESIKSLSSQSYTIVIIAHRLEALKYCDRIYKISEGKISPIKI